MPALLPGPPASSPRGHTRRDCSFAQPHYSERNNPVLLSKCRKLADALSLSPGLSQEDRTSCQLFGPGGVSNSTRQETWWLRGFDPIPCGITLGIILALAIILRSLGRFEGKALRLLLALGGGRSHDHWDIVSQSIHSPL